MKIPVHVPSKNNVGLTLIEVLIFTLVMSVVLITLTYATVLSIQINRVSQDKVKATRFAEELGNWIQGEKEIDFNTVTSSLQEGTYCVPDLPDSIEEIGSPTTCDNYEIEGRYKREITVTEKTETKVTYIITVSWQDGPRVFDVKISSLIAPWD